MSRHFTSYGDAFEKFDSGRQGALTYTDFQVLLNKIHEIADLPPPTF